MDKYVIISDNILSNTNFNTIINNLQKISEIFKITNLSPEFIPFVNSYGYVQLDLFVQQFINNSIRLLINSTKQKFTNTLIKFINSITGKTWFHINNLNERLDFYQKNLIKIGGEKYRKIFNSENITNFMNELYILSRKNKIYN